MESQETLLSVIIVLSNCLVTFADSDIDSEKRLYYVVALGSGLIVVSIADLAILCAICCCLCRTSDHPLEGGTTDAQKLTTYVEPTKIRNRQEQAIEKGGRKSWVEETDEKQSQKKDPNNERPASRVISEESSNETSSEEDEVKTRSKAVTKNKRSSRKTKSPNKRPKNSDKSSADPKSQRSGAIRSSERSGDSGSAGRHISITPSKVDERVNKIMPRKK